LTHLQIIKVEEEHAVVGIFSGKTHLCSVTVPKEKITATAKEGDEFSLHKKPLKKLPVKRTLTMKNGMVTKTENGEVVETRKRRTK
jgi:hypothetical protein